MIILNESLFEEYNESDNNLTEAKKRKKKKVSQVNPGEAIFKSVKDMQKWVKKRQKGMGYFVHMNCGNMDYNNDMFNKMNGADNSSSSGSDISTDVGGGASEGVSTGAGMGESLKLNEVREPKPDRSFIETTPFQNSWKQNGLNDEDLRELQNKIMVEPPEADLQGGLYKFRFAPKREARGQREAYRTIYYDFQDKKIVYLLYCFPKQEKANLSDAQLKYLRELSKIIRGEK